MQSQLDERGSELRRTVVIAIFAAVAAVLGIMESMIPFAVSIPGAKLGLGNIMVLTCLYYFRGRDALALILLKTLLTSFILGAFSTFLFSLFGALLSFVVMAVMLRWGRNHFSLVAISIVGGIMHNLGQLQAASIVLGTNRIFYYLPVLLISGIVTGVMVGLAAKYLIEALAKLDLCRNIGLTKS